MKTAQYKCKLLTDIIITAEASTEGYPQSLDYIPGSKFLGIAAGALYDEEKPEQTLDLFHNGDVQYGDATLYHNEQTYLKAPFSWYIEKGGSVYDQIYIHHAVKSKDKQLKQVRSGYFSTENKEFIKLDQDFSLKSAQDAEARRSKDGQMFGYHSLKAGSEWVFQVRDLNNNYEEKIKNALEGKHRIGRSRSAEYGLIEISYDQEIRQKNNPKLSEELIVYAKSNLCFIDPDTGVYTAEPTAEQLCGNKNAEINWAESQVRTRNYKTWNRKRKNKDADRIIIEKGSVFIINLEEACNSEFFLNGVGTHKTEGFGEVLLNPDFLSSMDHQETLPIQFKKEALKSYQKPVVKTGIEDEFVFQALQNIQKRGELDGQIDELVNQFEKNYGNLFKGISKSQWGTLRNYGKHITKRKDFDTIIFDKVNGFLYRGQSEKEWRKNNRRVKLQNQLEQLNDTQFFPFVIKLSNQMAKKN